MSLKVGNCWRQLQCPFPLHILLIFRLWLQLFLNLPKFSNIFCKWFSKKFSSWNFGFLSPTLGTNNHLTMTKDSICWYFGPRCCSNQVRSPFFVWFKSFNTLLQKGGVLSNFLSISYLKFWKKNCQIMVNLIWKDTHVNFPGT